MKRWIVIIPLGILILAGVFGAVHYFKERSITLISPKRGPIVEAVYGLGKVKAEKQFEIKLGVISTVERIFAKEGDHVEKGAPLIEFQTGTLFRAPFEGTITWVGFQQNETVGPQVSVMKLEDLSQWYIEVALEQQGAMRVKRGQAVRVSFESLRGELTKGVVQSIFPREGEFLVHVKLEELPAQVLPGMTADVAIEVSEKSDALLIPVSSITNGRVLVEREGKRIPVQLHIGTVDGTWAEVLDDALLVSDQIVVHRKK